LNGLVPITENHVGRTYPPTEPYRVSAAKIAEFAVALGDQNPAYAGETPDAPPTFAAVLGAAAWEALFADPELDLTLQRVVHADQTFVWHRPLRAGDTVTGVLSIDKVRCRGAMEIVGVTVRLATLDGEPVVDSSSTFVHTRAAS
jgi:acyl dehydratase